MTSVVISRMSEPPLPVSLRITSLYSRVDGPLMKIVNSHLPACQPEDCKEPHCEYFRWFLGHRKECKTEQCASCMKLQAWMNLHMDSCKDPTKCSLDVCLSMKKLQLKNTIQQLGSQPLPFGSSPAMSPAAAGRSYSHPTTPYGGSGSHYGESNSHPTTPYHAPNQNGFGRPNSYDTLGYPGSDSNSNSAASYNRPSSHVTNQNGLGRPDVAGYSGSDSYYGGATLGGNFRNNIHSSSACSSSQSCSNFTSNSQRPRDGFSNGCCDSNEPQTCLSSQHSSSSVHPTPQDFSMDRHQQSYSSSASNSSNSTTHSSIYPSPRDANMANLSPHHSNTNSHTPKHSSMTNHSSQQPDMSVTANYTTQHPNSMEHSNFGTINRFYDHSTYDQNSSGDEDSIRPSLMREGPMGLMQPSLDVYSSDVISFHKRTSVSSNASLASIRERLHHGGSIGSEVEQRELIQRMISLTQASKGSPNGGRKDSKTGSLDRRSIGRVTSQASFGNAALGRLDSMLETESSILDRSSSDSSLSDTKEGNFPDSGLTEVPQEDSVSSKPLRKKTSNHRLERSSNVSSVDLFDLDPIQPPHTILDSSPPPTHQPRPHHPVQRQESELNSRLFIHSEHGNSSFFSRRHSPSKDQSDGDSDGSGGGGVISNDVIGNNTTSSKAPVQRTDSLVSGKGAKMVLERGSIGMEQLHNIQIAQRRINLKNAGQSDQPSTANSKLGELNRSNRESYDMSEVSSSPFSLSPHPSDSTSQPSSLGDSGTGGEVCGMTSDLAQLDVIERLPLSLGRTPAYQNQTGGERRYENWPPYNPHPAVNDYTPSSPSSLGTLGEPPSTSSLSNHSTLTPNDHVSQSHDFSEKMYISSSSGYKMATSDCDNDRHGNSGGGLDPHIFGKHRSGSEGSQDEDGEDYDSHTHLSDGPEMSWNETEDKHLSKLGGRELNREELIHNMTLAIDRIREEHKDDIAVMNLKAERRPMVQRTPLVSPMKDTARSLKIDMASEADCDDIGMDVVLDANRPSLFPETEMELYRKSMELVDEQQAAVEDVNHREYLREFLLGQFIREQVYREGAHWLRQTRLGKGGQATCYSILDFKTNLSLALKEELEGDKSLDEAYICLKLANEHNVSLNIAEYFGAAMLPALNRNTVQLFMEIMPTSMQAYLFQYGPLAMSDVHHYSYQLFDALEYLHNKERIIHCDVKPANLLLDYTAQRMKLADFGAAEILENGHAGESTIFATIGAGTLAYNPPEHYSKHECSFALDLWQAGCCVLAMSTGRRPWRHLFMDPLPSGSKHHFNQLKKSYGEAIGCEKHGHILPGFLDATIKRLLYGCLHPDPRQRLTALECRQLLAYSGVQSEDQRRTVTEAMGYLSTPLVLQNSPDPASLSRTDIFLASFHQGVQVKGHSHTLYPGWVGSLPHSPAMTYQQLRNQILKPAFPVLEHLGPLELGVWGGTPQEFFVATNPSHSSLQSPAPSSPSLLHHPLFLPASPQAFVDPSKPVLLFTPFHLQHRHYGNVSSETALAHSNRRTSF